MHALVEFLAEISQLDPWLRVICSEAIRVICSEAMRISLRHEGRSVYSVVNERMNKVRLRR